MEWLEITGDSVDEAKEQALVHLGVHESDAEFEVLSEGRVGLFGRVKEEARVRARVIPTPVRPKESRGRAQGSRRGSSRRSQSASATTGKPVKKTKDSQQGRTTKSRKNPDDAGSGRKATEAEDVPSSAENTRKEVKSQMDTQNGGPSLLEQADIAEQFVKGVAETLGVPLTFVRHDLDNGILRIEANGEGVGVLIGRRGATAQAIDELVRTVLQRSGGSIREGKIRMDVGGLRARRAASLAVFVKSVAEDVVESGGEVALEPMNRMDRKIVHDVISEMEAVDSRSEGEDPNRRVVIAVLSD